MLSFNFLFRRKTIDQMLSDASIQTPSYPSLNKTLGVWDLTALGIAAILGAGVFSTMGNAAYYGGPAVIFLFTFTGIACAFSALCYAEFASTIPLSGSAYTYAYISFGEFMAWIIGWDLLMEYAISNIVVAISWSEYFIHFISRYGILIPKYLAMDFMTAYRGYLEVLNSLASGQSIESMALSENLFGKVEIYYAWLNAPRFLGIPIICNLPALFITCAITGITYIGIKESKKISNFLVLLKISVILLIIGLGAFYIRPENWIPFAPNGFSSTLKGISSVFFAYIGFDAISTTAEECRDPQKDLPKGMLYSLLVCTVLYILIAIILTGMVSYKHLGIGDPLAYVFGPEGVNLPWVSDLIALIGIIALATVLFVYQLGQPRIWMAMSRDGLLPPIFSAIHPKYKTPWFSTLLTCFAVSIPSLFMNLSEVADLTSTGTLFAYVIVCAGALRLKNHSQSHYSPQFRIPYINSKFYFPLIILIILIISLYLNPSLPEMIQFKNYSIAKIPFTVFCFEIIFLIFLCFFKNLSLIPVLGLSSCSYLITELGVTNWIRFGVWLLLGLLIYFSYGYKHSKLRNR